MNEKVELSSSLVSDSDAPSLTDYVRAVVNILEDFGDEKLRLETTQKAVLNILEDLDDEKRIAQEANRMKSEFLANMSHELRTPLNSIIGFSELMSDGKVGAIADNHKEYLGDILTSARHLLQLINDVLDLAKVEAGKLEFESKPIDINKLVHGIRDTLRSIAASRNIQVEVNVDKSLAEVLGDSARLKQVLYNYLSNALKFTPEGGHVLVSAEREGELFFRISVRDTGDGIAQEHLSRLFIEFEQLDASIGKRHQGTGLGLALTKRIVDAQGGYVGVESTVGEGSTFFAVLPISLRPEKIEPYAESLTLPLASLQALVVAADSRERDDIIQELNRQGYDTFSVSQGEAGLEEAYRQRWDLLILDVDLPDINGVNLLPNIRSNSPNSHTPVIVLSAPTDKPVILLTAQDTLIKPLRSGELLAAVKRVEKSGANKSHIMLVDDEPNDLMLMHKNLTDAGYYTNSYSRGEDALKAFSIDRPNAIIMDLSMPSMSGLELLQQLAKYPEAAHIPIIIWTEKDCTDLQRQNEFAVASAYIHKADGHEKLMNELKLLLVRRKVFGIRS